MLSGGSIYLVPYLMVFEGYNFDPQGEYVRWWLSELPTEWIHHPWNAPEPVLQVAGIELGSNYPLPIVSINAAKERLQEALSVMLQHEVASRAAMENGTEEGWETTDSTNIDFPQDVQMEENHETVRPNLPSLVRRYEDQMVPTITSLVSVEDAETTSGIQISVGNNRGEVTTTNVDVTQEVTRRDDRPASQEVQRNDILPRNTLSMGLPYDDEDSTAVSSSMGRRERDGGVVPVWSPSASSYSDQFVAEGNGIHANSSFLQRHPQSHWRRLSQTV
ncbi:hypothetical protein MLD38_034787 [Melastoma candidum]|uniref:Uncharacterized protein n=1 Tax=Melastoma candidum TaxID=119954 RepID=A0ACB9MAT0_9MYRT|nr:hypothetical protein MLD38_034787 [Melastoma candidum]